MVQLLDTTLREGEQTLGVRFSLKQKRSIAEMLDEFGIDYLEVGHPAVSRHIARDVKSICSMGLKAQTLAHARAVTTDVDEVLRAGSDWVGIFLGLSPILSKTRYSSPPDSLIQQMAVCISYAKQHGLNVRYSAEDATRTSLKMLHRLYSTAIEAGADRISIPDTAGVMTPGRMHSLVAGIKAAYSVPIHVHCHNDLGLATANSLAAFEAGAEVIDVTVNGLGERTGIAPLAEVSAALKVMYKVSNPWKLDRLKRISESVALFSGLNESPRTPVVGENAFTHVGGLHTMSVLKNVSSYQVLDPTKFARKVKINLNQFTGKSTLEFVSKMSGKNISTNIGEYKNRKKEDTLEI